MPGQTPTLQLPYPLPDDTVDVPRDVKALADALDPLGTVPVGAFMLWPTAIAPLNWLLMVGQQVDAALYPKLATLLGQSGGLVTIPDMRDFFPVGAGASPLGATGGAASVKLTGAQSGERGHNHSGLTGARDRAQVHSHTGGTQAVFMGSGGENLIGYLMTAQGSPYGVKNQAAGLTADNADVPDHLHTIAMQAARDADAAHENRPPFRAVNFIMRAG